MCLCMSVCVCGGGGWAAEVQYNIQYNYAAFSRWVYIFSLFDNTFLTKQYLIAAIRLFQDFTQKGAK